MAASWPIVCSTCIQHQNNPNYQIIYLKLYTSNVFPFFSDFSFNYTNRLWCSTSLFQIFNFINTNWHIESFLHSCSCWVAAGCQIFCTRNALLISVIWNIISCNVCDHVNILLHFLPPLRKQTLCAQKGVTNLTKCACTQAC